MDIRAFLKGKKDEWATQAARSKEPRQFQRVDDGVYLLDLDTVELTTNNSGDPQVLWKWIVSDNGEFHGEIVYDRDGLAREDAFYWLWIKLDKFGFDPDEWPDPTKLDKLLKQLQDRKPRIKGKLFTKGEWQNLQIMQVLDGDEDPDDDGDDTSDDEDVDLEVGMNVEFELGGNTLTGKVTAIDEDAQTAKVKVGTKTHTVGFDDISIPEDEAEPVPPPPPPPPAAKAGPAGKGKAKPAPEPDPEPDPDSEEGGDDETAQVPEVGDVVKFDLGGNEVEGIVTAVDEDGETATVKVGKKSHTVAFDDIIPDAEVELEVGMQVSFELNGTEVTGIVTAIDEDAEEAKVKVGKKTHTVAISELTIEDDETDD
jgi:FKBP-type peptidyl-prolyl cis-trans isomerase 2